MSKWCIFTFAAILSLLFGCQNSKGDLTVQGIFGPSSIDEGASAAYSVSATGDSGLQFTWAVSPPSAGSIVDPESSVIVFQTTKVDADLDAKLSVTVVSDHKGPLVKETNLTILDMDSGNGGPGTPSTKPWARTWGSHYDTGWDGGNDVSLDAAGDAYVAGAISWEADFDPGPNTDQYNGVGWENAFLTKYDETGNYLWARAWGAWGDDSSLGVAAVSDGGAYVAGYFGEDYIDLDPGPASDIVKCAGYRDAFLSRFDGQGNLLWALTWGGIANDFAVDVALDHSNNVYVVGGYGSMIDLDPGAGTTLASGDTGTFLTKFDSLGEHQWSVSWGAVANYYGSDSKYHYPVKVAIDSGGNIYVAGHFSGTVDFDPGPGFADASGTIYLSKFDPSGNFLWVKTWGPYEDFQSGPGNTGLAIDSNDNVYVTSGFTGTVDFDPGSGVYELTAGGQNVDPFLVKLDSSGNFVWASECIKQEANGNQRGVDVAVDKDKGVYVFSQYSLAVDFFSAVSYLTLDGEVVTQWDNRINAGAIAVSTEGNVYLTGSFSNTADFLPGTEEDMHVSAGNNEAYLDKLPLVGDWGK